MAADLGDVRTGLAICDKLEMLAVPLCTLSQPNCKNLVVEIAALAKKNEIELLVLGHPQHLNGSNGERALKAAGFAQRLRETSGLPVVLWDERLTTVFAHQVLAASGHFGKNKKKLVDVVAAVLILENYLAFRKNRKETQVPKSK